MSEDDAKVVGHNTDDAGTPVGVWGAVDSGDGYGLATPDDVKIGGHVDGEVDWRVLAEDGSEAGNIIQGHSENQADDAAGATVAGGGSGSFSSGPNTVSGNYGTIGGGRENDVSGGNGTIGGGNGNVVSGGGGTIGGGSENQVTGSDATVAGGRGNEAADSWAVVVGGSNNVADGNRNTVGGGSSNEATGDYAATIAGGWSSKVTQSYASVGGGFRCNATGESATTAGGYENWASGEKATVSGGEDNTASGGHATVPGGRNNLAAGNYSFAAGRNAEANHDGAFVFGDSTSGSVSSNAGDEARFQMEIVAESGVDDQSARAAKTNVEPVDTGSILDGVRSLDVCSWEYRDGDGCDGRTHVGPMAEDFHEAFDVGGSDRTINSIDRGGVALASIQELSMRLDETDDRIDERAAETETVREELAEKDERIDELESRNQVLEERLATLEAQVGTPATVPTDD